MEGCPTSTVKIKKIAFFFQILGIKCLSIFFINNTDQQKYVNFVTVIWCKVKFGEKVMGDCNPLNSKPIIQNKRRKEAKSRDPLQRAPESGVGMETTPPCLFLTTSYFPHQPHRAQGTPVPPGWRIQRPLSSSGLSTRLDLFPDDTLNTL